MDDLQIHQMVLAVCGGSPGERDELDPGNGAVGLCPKSGRESISNDPLAAAAAATAVASGRNSAEENTSAAAEAALQVNARSPVPWCRGRAVAGVVVGDEPAGGTGVASMPSLRDPRIVHSAFVVLCSHRTINIISLCCYRVRLSWCYALDAHCSSRWCFWGSYCNSCNSCNCLIIL